MINKRKKYPSDGQGSLADVNEQELAKDIEFPIYREKTGTAPQKEESVPEIFPERALCEQKQATEFIIVDTQATGALVKSESREVLGEDSGEKSTCESATDGVPEQEPKCDSVSASKKKRGSRGGGVYAAVIVLCLIASIALVMLFRFGGSEEPSVAPNISDGADDSNMQTDIPQISDTPAAYARAARSAVGVVSTRGAQQVYYSGVSVLEGGYIATLYEAVSEGSAEVITSDGSRFAANVVGASPAVNLALLSIGTTDLPAAAISGTDSVSVGSSAFAIANIGGGQYPSSLLDARVSYKDRQVEISFPDGYVRRVCALQLDMTAAEGLGGCPIFDENGAVIGMIIASEGGACMALPMSDIIPILECMRDGREADGELISVLAKQLPCLGILGEQAEENGVWGVVVRGFDSEGGDAKISLREGDIIWKIGEQLVADTQALRSALDAYSAGERVEVFVLRNGQRLSYFITLGAK